MFASSNKRSYIPDRDETQNSKSQRPGASPMNIRVLAKGPTKKGNAGGLIVDADSQFMIVKFYNDCIEKMEIGSMYKVKKYIVDGYVESVWLNGFKVVAKQVLIKDMREVTPLPDNTDIKKLPIMSIKEVVENKPFKTLVSVVGNMVKDMGIHLKGTLPNQFQKKTVLIADASGTLQFPILGDDIGQFVAFEDRVTYVFACFRTFNNGNLCDGTEINSCSYSGIFKASDDAQLGAIQRKRGDLPTIRGKIEGIGTFRIIVSCPKCSSEDVQVCKKTMICNACEFMGKEAKFHGKEKCSITVTDEGDREYSLTVDDKDVKESIFGPHYPDLFQEANPKIAAYKHVCDINFIFSLHQNGVKIMEAKKC